jgi:hypothetical protein
MTGRLGRSSGYAIVQHSHFFGFCFASPPAVGVQHGHAFDAIVVDDRDGIQLAAPTVRAPFMFRKKNIGPSTASSPP